MIYLKMITKNFDKYIKNKNKKYKKLEINILKKCKKKIFTKLFNKFFH